MSGDRLKNKRVVITSADSFMGPAIAELFTAEGAEVQTDNSDLTGPDDAARLVSRAGRIDVLVANFDVPADRAKTVDIRTTSRTRPTTRSRCSRTPASRNVFNTRCLLVESAIQPRLPNSRCFLLAMTRRSSTAKSSAKTAAGASASCAAATQPARSGAITCSANLSADSGDDG